MMKTLILPLIAAANLLTACGTSPKAQGQKVPAGAVTVDPFTRLEVDGRIYLTFVQTKGTPRVVYSTAVATARHIDVTSTSHTLRIRTVRTETFDDDMRFAVTVYAPAPETIVCNGVSDAQLGDIRTKSPLRITLNGPGDIEAGRIEASEFTAENRSSGDMDIKGVKAANVQYATLGPGDLRSGITRCENLGSSLRGPGDLTLHDVKATTAVARLRGSGDLAIEDIKAERLDARLDGAGDLTLSGIDAGTLTAHLYGAGDITLTGKAEKAKLSLSGVGTLDASTLRVKEVDTDHRNGHGELIRP